MKTITRLLLTIFVLSSTLGAATLAQGAPDAVLANCVNLTLGSARLIYTSSVKAEFQISVTNSGATPLTLTRAVIPWVRYSGGANNGMRMDYLKLKSVIVWNGATSEDLESPTDSNAASDPGGTGRSVTLNAGQTAQWVARFTNNPADLATRWSLNDFNGATLYFGACTITYTSGPLPTPTQTPTRTNTPFPGATATRTPTPGPSPTPYPGALSFPYGPFYLPSGMEGPPYTGAMQSLSVARAVMTLDDARAAGFHLLVNLGGNRVNFQKPDGSFDLQAWKDLVTNFAGVINPYIADGTIVGHLMFDEPQDPSNWNGVPVPCADIEAAAAYSKSLWPNLQAGAGTHATWIATLPCQWDAFDFTLTPYTSKWGAAASFAQSNVAAAASVGIKYYASINTEIGGATGSEVTAAELLSFGTAFISHPNVCGLTLWKYNDDYFTRPDITPVLEDLGALAMARGPCP